MSDIRYDDQVVIVTGSGNGLGKSHALEFARRGAKVVINDFGGARDGTGGSSEAAEAVVAEIEAMGGEAIANGANVTDRDQVAAMVQQTMDKWGRIDVLVNNAGILRDRSFGKMTGEEWDAVVAVHLTGSANCSLAVWNIMKAQNYGRIVM
ncbi:MAG: SDR family NAD(P)-dependent oxidoreductase, partial [Pseudomonadota bacterium]